MPVPIVNFRPILEATKDNWQQRLRELLEGQWVSLGEPVRAFEAEFAWAGEAAEGVGVGTGAGAT